MPDQEDQSLATLLNVEQRGELSVLIAQTTERMRSDLVQTFEISDPTDTSSLEDKTKNLNLSPEDKENQASLKSEVQLSQADRETEKRVQEKRESALSVPKVRELKATALDCFDTWRDSVILRVGEVVNSRDHAQQGKDSSHAKKVASHSSAGSTVRDTQSLSQRVAEQEHQHTTNDAMMRAYPPLTTPLASLSQGERYTILNAILLLLLSLESYKAHSRTLLLRLATSLHVPSAEVTKMEKNIAYGLLTAASHMDGSASTDAASKANATARKWKVGLASVAGAALIGVTGGLAAPLVAAGVGGLMGGLGLGATAAAGYLGAMAGSGVLVGGLFGAYGGRMTGRMMDQYAKEVEDFAFMPIRNAENNHEEAKKLRRLRVTVGISGWLKNKDDVVSPWKVLGDGGEAFALKFELAALLSLGNGMGDFVKSYAWGYIKKEIIKRTIIAGLWSALMAPLAMLKLSTKVIDNPFSIAKARADKAGEVLADALIQKAQGERPVSLVGYSLGARVIYSCLLSLAERKAFGLVDSVVLMGAPMPSDSQDWQTMRSVVSGRLINVFSENDYVLAFMYRASAVQLGVAGMQAVEGVRGVENVNLSEEVNGHSKYQFMVGQILAKIGWSDLDEGALQREARLLAEEKQKEEDEEQHVGDEVDEKKLAAEAEKLDKVSSAVPPPLPARPHHHGARDGFADRLQSD